MPGVWTLECPNQGVYQGVCSYKVVKGRFILECKKGLDRFKAPENDSCDAPEHTFNPHGRKYLPHGLTECEKQHKDVQELLSRCIRALEPKQKTGEIRSAVAVCRKNIGCPL